MNPSCWLLLFSLLFLVVGAPSGMAESPPLTPPVVNEPASFKTFGRPVGTLFEASMDVQPREVSMDAALTLTIRIAYKGQPVERPQKGPTAPAAERLDESFDESFRTVKTVQQVDGTSWRFSYFLWPRNPDVRRVPALLFTYYSPLGYRTMELPNIEIKVLPRQELSPQELDKPAAPSTAPPSIHRFALGPAVLGPDERWNAPGLLIGAFALPPLFCLAWYRLWSHLYPDEAVRLRRRRSRAAKLALRGLDLARATRPDLHGNVAAAIVTTYLRERLNLPMIEPTPRETAEHLAGAGCTVGVIDTAARFFELCDAARFAAEPGGSRRHVLTAGADLIRALEQDPMNAVLPRDGTRPESSRGPRLRVS